MSALTSKRTVRLLLAGLALVSCGVVIFMLKAKERPPVTPSHISQDDLRGLEQRAAAGDPVAQYGLTLYIDDEKRVNELIKKAAKSGYPPAVVTYADRLISQEKPEGLKAKGILEDVAKQGYFPAITLLASCRENGECGLASKEDALKWAAFARLLIVQKNSDKKKLYLYDVDNKSLESDKKNASEVEQRLRKELKSSEVDQAYAAAKSLISQMPNM